MIHFHNDLPCTDEEAMAAACLLNAHPDYKVLRRLGDLMPLATPAPAGNATRIAAIVDVETTGLDPARDRIIELAIQRIRFTQDGQITEVGLVRSWREDPGFPLDPAITKLTGLTDADLAGAAIDDAEASAMLASADVVIAHNASFDAAFVEARLPGAAGLNWACTHNEVNWHDHGCQGRSLGHLLLEIGYFFQGHRAESDVSALVYLLAYHSCEGVSVLAALIARAERPTVRIDALGAPFDRKDLLKSRGYRWNVVGRYWWTEVSEADVEGEQIWLARNGCDQGPRMTPRTWQNRHR